MSPINYTLVGFVTHDPFEMLMHCVYLRIHSSFQTMDLNGYKNHLTIQFYSLFIILYTPLYRIRSWSLTHDRSMGN